MIGDRVRALREERGWTQIHLAETSGVGLRTIQRIETRHSYSAESAMALASALNVNVGDLIGPTSNSPGEFRPLWRAPEPRTAALVAIGLSAPGAVFMIVNTLKQLRITAGPFDTLAALGASLHLDEIFLAGWYIPLIVAPLAALGLLAASCLRVHGKSEGSALTITGLEMRWHPLAAAAALLAFATVFAPLANIFAELLSDALA